MLLNHSKFLPTDQPRFLVGTRLLSALEMVGSCMYKFWFLGDFLKFLMDLVSTLFSNVIARSDVGLELSWFCPKTLHGSDH